MRAATAKRAPRRSCSPTGARSPLPSCRSATSCTAPRCAVDTGAMFRRRYSTTGRRSSPPWRVTLADGTELIASGDHRFLTERGWKHVTGTEHGRDRRPYLTTGNRMIGVGRLAQPPVDDIDYRRGYLTGMIRGDGTLGHYDYTPPWPQLRNCPSIPPCAHGPRGLATLRGVPPGPWYLHRPAALSSGDGADPGGVHDLGPEPNRSGGDRGHSHLAD